uniref:HDC14238 n=1 Tax=Drosophila melanogaster TaxID=7227 RepID=Q6IJT7_DROME|nr:TPA_inf: HDC14238 [Drosophila melanogaster]
MTYRTIKTGTAQKDQAAAEIQLPLLNQLKGQHFKWLKRTTRFGFCVEPLLAAASSLQLQLQLQLLFAACCCHGEVESSSCNGSQKRRATCHNYRDGTFSETP